MGLEHLLQGQENYDFGVIRAWLDDYQICYIQTDGCMQRDGVDTWADLIIATIEAWPTERPIVMLQNLTHPNQGFTPYSRYRGLDILSSVPPNHIAICAIVMQKSLINRFLGFLFNSMNFRNGISIRIFTDNDEALTWLRTEIQEHNRAYV